MENKSNNKQTGGKDTEGLGRRERQSKNVGIKHNSNIPKQK
jgi:hypothetical protein